MLTLPNIENHIFHGYELAVRWRCGEIEATVWRHGVVDSHHFVGRDLQEAMIGLEHYLERRAPLRVTGEL